MSISVQQWRLRIGGFCGGRSGISKMFSTSIKSGGQAGLSRWSVGCVGATMWMVAFLISGGSTLSCFNSSSWYKPPTNTTWSSSSPGTWSCTPQALAGFPIVPIPQATLPWHPYSPASSIGQIISPPWLSNKA